MARMVLLWLTVVTFVAISGAAFAQTARPRQPPDEPVVTIEVIPRSADTPWERDNWCSVSPARASAAGCGRTARADFWFTYCTSQSRITSRSQCGSHYGAGRDPAFDARLRSACLSDPATPNCISYQQSPSDEYFAGLLRACTQDPSDAECQSYYQEHPNAQYATALQRFQAGQTQASTSNPDVTPTQQEPPPAPADEVAAAKAKIEPLRTQSDLPIWIWLIPLVLALAIGIALFVRRRSRAPSAEQRVSAPRTVPPSSGPQAPATYAFFISHASADVGKARTLVSALEARGARCWVAPRDVRPGNSYAAEITHGIEAAPVFVVLISAKSNDSGPVLNEVELARRFSRILVPVFLEEIELSKALLYYLSAAQWIDYAKDREGAVEQILAARR